MPAAVPERSRAAVIDVFGGRAGGVFVVCTTVQGLSAIQNIGTTRATVGGEGTR